MVFFFGLVDESENNHETKEFGQGLYIMPGSGVFLKIREFLSFDLVSMFFREKKISLGSFKWVDVNPSIYFRYS